MVLRTARTDEGECRVLQPLRLAAFLETPQVSGFGVDGCAIMCIIYILSVCMCVRVLVSVVVMVGMGFSSFLFAVDAAPSAGGLHGDSTDGQCVHV